MTMLEGRTGQINIQFLISLVMFSLVFTLVLTQYSQTVSNYIHFSYQDSLENVAQTLIWQLINDPGFKDNCNEEKDPTCFNWNAYNYTRIGLAHPDLTALSYSRIMELQTIFDDQEKGLSIESYLKMIRALNVPNHTFHIMIERVPNIAMDAMVSTKNRQNKICEHDLPICISVNASESDFTSVFYINQTNIGPLECYPVLIKADKGAVPFNCTNDPSDNTGCYMNSDNACIVNYKFSPDDISGAYIFYALFNNTFSYGVRTFNFLVDSDNAFEKGNTFGVLPNKINCTVFPMGGRTCTIRLSIRPDDMDTLHKVRLRAEITNVTDLTGKKQLTTALRKYISDIAIVPDRFLKIYGGGQRDVTITFFMQDAGNYYGRIIIEHKDGSLRKEYVSGGIPFHVKVLNNMVLFKAGMEPQAGSQSATARRYIGIYDDYHSVANNENRFLIGKITVTVS